MDLLITLVHRDVDFASVWINKKEPSPIVEMFKER